MPVIARSLMARLQPPCTGPVKSAQLKVTLTIATMLRVIKPTSRDLSRQRQACQFGSLSALSAQVGAIAFIAAGFWPAPKPPHEAENAGDQQRAPSRLS